MFAFTLQVGFDGEEVAVPDTSLRAALERAKGIAAASGLPVLVRSFQDPLGTVWPPR